MIFIEMQLKVLFILCKIQIWITSSSSLTILEEGVLSIKSLILPRYRFNFIKSKKLYEINFKILTIWWNSLLDSVFEFNDKIYLNILLDYIIFRIW